MPRVIYLYGKKHWCSLKRRLGGFHSQCGNIQEQKNLLALPESNII
jgi:hypothetical protein